MLFGMVSQKKTDNRKEYYINKRVPTHLYFTSIFLSNYIVCKSLKNVLLLLNSYYNDDEKSVKRKMLSTKASLRRSYIEQGFMSLTKSLSTLFLRVIHNGVVDVSRVHI